MDIRELRSFVILGEQLHFGRAARLLHLSQPALSKQIRRLESELGGQLLDRGKHGARLTSFGRQFFDDARSTVNGFVALRERARRAASGETGRLRIGFGYHTFDLVPRLIVYFRAIAPGVEISLRDRSTAEQMDDLASDRIDLGFARLPVSHPYAFLPAVRDRLMLVSARDSSFPARGTVVDAADQPFVSISQTRAPGFYGHTLRLCARHGFHPRIAQEVPEFTTALALVRAGLGLAFIPASLWTASFEGLRRHTVHDREAEWEVGAIWRKSDTNVALRRFLELIAAQRVARSRHPNRP